MSAFSCRPHSEFAALARRFCSECRAGDLRWSSARDLAWSVEPGDRLRVFELVDFCGPDSDAWFCPACGAWGIFGERE